MDRREEEKRERGGERKEMENREETGDVGE